ncbi:MAG: hypothetical protein QM668_00605 [Agriterribacter sp.]|nr:MAG: hypothetical protein BGP13_14430 [Sphingobacteriales bacterium 40-81]
MTLNLFDPELTYISSEYKLEQRVEETSGTITRSGIKKSDQLTGIELRLLPPYILDNSTKKTIFSKDFAKVYCLVIVVSDANNQLVGGIDLQGFPRIGDNEHLPINKTIFYWQQDKANDIPPSQIHALCSIIKSKKDLRDVAEIMQNLKTDADYNSIIGGITNLATNGAVVGAALGLVTNLASIVGKFLGNVEDKPIGTIINSYTSLYGDFNTLGVVKKAYPTKNVHFEIDIIVQNKQALKSSTPQVRGSDKNNAEVTLARPFQNVLGDLHALS